MRLADYLDQGVFLNPDEACFITDGDVMSYREVQALSYRIANGLLAAGLDAESKFAGLMPCYLYYNKESSVL